MTSFIPVISLLLVMIVSLLIVRVATVALVLTGLSKQLARFQARSAFTGAGFTTSESEKVTQHPLRRRIIMLLMLLGNAGFVTAISSLMLSFINNNDAATVGVPIKIAMLCGGVAILWTVANSRWIDRHMSSLIEWGLKRFTDLEVRDYSGLLHLARGYSVAEMAIEVDSWMANRELVSLRLSDEGVLVLGVERSDGEYLGAPRGHTRINVGDTVILYGPNEGLESLDKRRTGSNGNWEHHIAVDKQRKVEKQEQGIAESTA